MCRNEVEEHVLFRQTEGHLPIRKLPGWNNIPSQNCKPVMGFAAVDMALNNLQLCFRTFYPLMKDPILPVKIPRDVHVAVAMTRLSQDGLELWVLRLKGRFATVQMIGDQGVLPLAEASFMPRAPSNRNS